MKIGDEFGKRDHSTVMSACEKVEKGLKNDETYRQAVGELEKLMQVKQLTTAFHFISAVKSDKIDL